MVRNVKVNGATYDQYQTRVGHRGGSNASKRSENHQKHVGSCIGFDTVHIGQPDASHGIVDRASVHIDSGAQRDYKTEDRIRNPARGLDRLERNWNGRSGTGASKGL
jgi:hypothetical protein